MVFYVLIRGPLGVGKSTVAKRLAGKVEAEYISIDRILDERGLETWYRGYVSQRSFLRANAYAVRRARPFLQNGRPVIFDGNFYYKSQIEDLIGQLDCRHYVFTLKAPLSLCIKRDGRRVPPYGREAARAVYAISTGFECGIGIDATRSVERVVDDIVTRLSKDPAENPR
ncbi:MAG: AAA family ATPase [Thermoplasmata archaeon]